MFSSIDNDRVPELTQNDTEMVQEDHMKTPEDFETTQEYVEHYFADAPVMARVAYCESKFIQFNEDGSVLRGQVTPADVGVMQINEGYHLETSQELGYDIHTLEGNLEYARYLYEKKGVQPWSASRRCWASDHLAMR